MGMHTETQTIKIIQTTIQTPKLDWELVQSIINTKADKIYLKSNISIKSHSPPSLFSYQNQIIASLFKYKNQNKENTNGKNIFQN